MSDSLVLTGVKDVRKQTGTEMLRRNPKGGGDTFHLKRWWVEGGSSTVYVDATIFDVSTGSGSVKLAIASNMSTNLRIDHDGSFNFAFIGANEVSRAALFTSDMFSIADSMSFLSSLNLFGRILRSSIVRMFSIILLTREPLEIIRGTV